MTFAAGLACQGMKPVVAIYSTFLQRAFDQIVHDVALQCLPVIFAIDRGGLVGEDGPTHHGILDLSMLRQIPNMTIMAPKDEDELRHLLKTAVQHQQGPIAVRYPRGSGVGVTLAPKLRAIDTGTWEVLREGADAAILAVGSMVHSSLQAARSLSQKSIEVTVINCRFVKPLDEDILKDIVGRHHHMFTVEENVLAGGFGNAVMEYMGRNHLRDVPLSCMGLPDQFIEHGSRDHLLKDVQLNAEGICRRVQKELKTK